MEIYVNKVNFVEFEAPRDDTEVSAVALIAGASVPLDVTTPTTEPGIRIAELPYLYEECDVVVTWKFSIDGNNIEKTERYTAVTPYVSHRWIKRNLMEYATDDKIREAEASARFIINAHTGQTFGKHRATTIVNGAGKNSIALNHRLVEIESINGIEKAKLPVSYSITGDGWFITHNVSGIPPLKADYYGLHQVNGVIENPYGVRAGGFVDGAPYQITGVWGWDEVPEAITEAAKLLVNDYASGDSLYRDRYLVSMTAADWRIQFTNDAFRKTGNARADQLLEPYVIRRGWAVV